MTRGHAGILDGSWLVLFVLVTTAWMGRPCPAAAEGAGLSTFIEADQLEYRVRHGDDAYSWEAQGWVGGDYDRVWFKTRGDGIMDGAVERAETQLLYSRTVTAFWDVQLGARYDRYPDPARGYAVVGIQGSPYFFEIDAAAFVSQEGDVSARLEAEYDCSSPSDSSQSIAELNVSAQDVEDLGIGSRERDRAGVALRYEIARKSRRTCKCPGRPVVDRRRAARWTRRGRRRSSPALRVWF
jgi:copper resistance protein B